jgi:hypothetical protein
MGPRVPAIPPNPAGLSTSTQACNTAGYLATDIIRASLSKVVADYNAGQTEVNIVLGLASLIPGLGLVADIAIGAGVILNNALAGAGTGPYTTALGDSTLWARVTCAIYVAISGVGYVDASNFATVAGALGAVSYADAGVISTLVAYWNSLGLTGVQAAQAAGALYTADCSGCGWCYHWDLTAGQGGWSVLYGVGHYEAGVGFVADSGGSSEGIYMGRSDIPAQALASIALTMTHPTDTATPESDIELHHAGATSGVIYFAPANSAAPQTVTLDLSASIADFVQIYLHPAGTTARVIITGITLRGSGANPFGPNNC